MEQQQDFLERLITVKNGLRAGTIFFAFILFLMSYFTVQQYERGIVTTWGRISYVAAPGIGFMVPLVQSVTRYRTDIRSITPKDGAKANTYTLDNQEVDILFTLFYRISPDKVEFVYTNAQDYQARLYNLANDRLKAEMGKINVAHFTEKRAEIRDKIRDVLKRDSEVLGVEVTDFQLTDVEYTKSFRSAVEAAASAKAMVETREQERVQALKIADRAKIDAEGKANAVREGAKGDADATLVKAQANAKAIKLEGEAKADAMRAQADALARNPVLVEMKKAETWNGVLPQAIYAGAPIPFFQVK